MVPNSSGRFLPARVSEPGVTQCMLKRDVSRLCLKSFSHQTNMFSLSLIGRTK